MRPAQAIATILLATTTLLAACSAPAPTAPAATAAAPAKAAAAATPTPPSAAATKPAAATAASAAGAPAAKAAAPAGGQDSCSAIPGAELAGVLGKQITRQQTQSPTRCIYYTDDPLVYVDLDVDRENGPAAWKAVNGGNTTIGASQDAVPGLGDQAFFGPRDRLYILKGSTFLAVEAGFDAEVRDRAMKVARLALTRV
jgi:hypothetical protein